MSSPKRDVQPRSGPLVFGAGLMRTGTHSQMLALETLLGGRCYHMEVIMKEKRSHLKLWYKAATEGLTKELADEIFQGFRSSTDFPAAHFYQELAEIYPHAKFVLSVRDQKRWVESVRATVKQSAAGVCRMLPPVRWLFGVSYYVPVQRAIFGPRMGFSYDMSDEEMIRAFDRHTQSVMQAIPKERLLVFRVSDGWEPLCEFLGVPVPDVPFPNVNDTAHFRRFVRLINVVGPVANLAFCASVGCLIWFGARFVMKKLA